MAQTHHVEVLLLERFHRYREAEGVKAARAALVLGVGRERAREVEPWDLELTMQHHVEENAAGIEAPRDYRGALARLAEAAEGVVEGQEEDRQEPRGAQPGVQGEQGANQGRPAQGRGRVVGGHIFDECGHDTTSQWRTRRREGKVHYVCNACGLREKNAQKRASRVA